MYGLVMIVRDGGAALGDCLASLRPHIGAWTICDTGSIDGTPELVEHGLDGIPGRLYRDPWVNFGHNRSLAFARARGTADWLLASDADMRWEIDPSFIPDPNLDAYLIDMGGDPGFANRLPLVLRGDLAWESRGAVHEYTALPNRAYLSAQTDGIRVTQPGGRAWTPEKGRWHAAMLEEALAQKPDDPRTVFYLAKTLDELGDPRAKGLYEQRVRLGGWPEETYYAAYRAALLEPHWPARASALMTAWEMRPNRLEALHALVEGLNQRGQHHAAWLLSGITVEPCEDSLFVHRAVWDWGLLFERQIAAWWVGSPLFEPITDRLLSLDLPSHIRSAVERNASLRAA